MAGNTRNRVRNIAKVLVWHGLGGTTQSEHSHNNTAAPDTGQIATLGGTTQSDSCSNNYIAPITVHGTLELEQHSSNH